MNKLQKLPQELVNQIAAGEVIERPASIVKELVDNAIDAKASVIKIKVEEGGIKNIEITDNGTGIPEVDLVKVFDAHTTSKISSIEDLNEIMTMGFRGEALSTIVSVAKVKASSRHTEGEYGYEIAFDGITPQTIKKSAKEQGTTITVSDLFYNVPARRKYLKTPETEYRKILEILQPFFLRYDNIHFLLIKDGKEVLNLPAQVENAPSKELNLQRIKQVLKGEYIDRMFMFKSSGSGAEIFGYAGHPQDNYEKTSNQYIFINDRPIWDFGIAKSIRSAYSRYIPQTQKVPFLISIHLKNNLVDVNVHPRKEEVRFENPFRIYSAVEEAVSHALQNLVKTQNSFTANQPEINYITPEYKQYTKVEDRGSSNYNQGMFKNDTSSRDIRFDKGSKDFSIKQSLNFSKELLDIGRDGEENHGNQVNASNVFQIFNKYILIESGNELIMMDQHAAAERINFEKLEKSLENVNMDVQNLLLPTNIPLSEVELTYLTEYRDFFEKLGFKFTLDENGVDIHSIPSIFNGYNVEELFRSVFDISEVDRDIKKSFENSKNNILATLACHGSIRKGQSLTPQEGLNLYFTLLKCTNPYSCPHGRPAIWKQKLSEIDTNFYRTY
ncbi:DNA mismatch repair endonuclease MutL [Candidatus Dojkabacteria bacterium]|nr:DNA mismatch repair endonuclease MutL [Candidatus Dojkabacteria bacterium]